MLQQIAMLMIVAMVVFLTSLMWTNHPEQSISQAEELRVKKVVLMPFRE